MKRPIPDVLRRGLESAMANWPLIALRIAENVLFLMLIVASIIAAVVPVLVSIGIAAFDADNPAESATAIGTALLEHLSVFLWIFLGALVVMFLMMVIHSFVMAGCTRTLVDADGSRGPLKVFNMERWLSGGKQSMWTVFWIYNITYGTTLIPVLVPLVLTLAGILAFRDQMVPIAIIGCSGIAIALFLFVIACIIASIWSLKAMILAVERDLGASDAAKVAWAEAKSDFGRHFAVAFILLVVSVGGAATISTFSVFFSVPTAHNAYMSLAFAPARMVISLFQSVFSAAAGMWMLASFAALSDRP